MNNQQDRVKTDYILFNTVTNIRKCFYPMKIFISARNRNEEKVGKRVLKFCKRIYFVHHIQIYNICRNFLYFGEKNKLEEMLLSIYDQLFADSISWSRIILFMIIISRLMTYYRYNDLLFVYFYSIVKEKLELWIKNHNGWEVIKIDEHLAAIPYINLESFIFRRSERFRHKKVKYKQYFE